MNAETLQIISYLLDQHTAKDSLVKTLTDELDGIKKQQEATKNSMVPPQEIKV